MGRRPVLTKNNQLWRFLIAVYQHPWSTRELIEQYTGLSPQAVQHVAQRLALKHGFVERCDLPGEARAARRFGLTPKGAALLGRPLPRSLMRDAFLRAHHLDIARQLLAEQAIHHPLRWACSPFTLSAECVRPERSRKKEKVKPEQFGDGAYRSLRLDALACVQVSPGQYRHVAIWVDPGDINLDWFYYQFRSAYAWNQRSEFHGRSNTFPLFVIVAADWERSQKLLQLWWEARPGQSGHTLSLRLTTRAWLERPESERKWWLNQHDTITGSWGRVYPFEHLTVVPPALSGAWWGATETKPDYFRPIQKKRHAQGLLKWAGQAKTIKAWTVQNQRVIHNRERELLDRVGQYPLIAISDLAVVLGHTYKAVADGMKRLYEGGLVFRPRVGDPGYALTPWGLELLAAQAGFSPTDYAKLRRWPIRVDGKTVEFAIDLFLSCRRHSQLVLDFLVGLRRYGPNVDHHLQSWNQVQCLTDWPYRSPPERRRSKEKPLPPHGYFISPDAVGRVRAFDPSLTQFVTTDFWLEVDRGTERGQVLWDKLARYYRMQSRQSYWIRHWPRLLILVDGDDETRLQAIVRKLKALSQRYHHVLDVRLTRADLLDDGKGRLDPSLKKWRTLEDDEFVYAFDQPVSPAIENLPR